MKFYLGTHLPHWLGQVGVPLFVSHRRLRDRKTLPEARVGWALDSGGFTELSMHGEWETTHDGYIASVRRYAEQIGRLEWAAPQDWMCEPHVLAQTGLTVAEHQKRTIASYCGLVADAPDLPWVPVLQGWAERDYIDHIGQYADAGVDLSALPLVGIGSVCRRQGTDVIARILSRVSAHGIELHGFGVKTQGLAKAAPYLSSADSMAWSTAGRYDRLPGHTHGNCANCVEYAMRWRDRVVVRLGGDVWSHSSASSQRWWQQTLPSTPGG